MNNDIGILDQWFRNLDRNWFVYIKRLSSNDTGLTGGHQVGVYIPANVMRQVFPEMQRLDITNPDYSFPARIVSHNFPEQTLRAIYYNSKPRGSGTRNEQRITRWNTDVSDSPIQNPENTGALVVLAFHRPVKEKNCDGLEVWVCDGEAEEDLVEAYTGEVVPGDSVYGCSHEVLGGMTQLPVAIPEGLTLPAEWAACFPDGATIVEYVVRNLPVSRYSADDILIKRRQKEYQVFRAVEEMHILDSIKKGFNSVDEFISLANAVSNRRKSRSGRSLELHLEQIFKEMGLNEFGTQCVTESRKKPDFLFPSCEKYHDSSWPVEKLRMLAVKTTCKDRWRQVINEADRIDTPYLFTLQEGVSVNQFAEMESAGVRLVVPEALHRKYPEILRPKLFTLSHFIVSTSMLYHKN